jgi:hypothetical protein
VTQKARDDTEMRRGRRRAFEATIKKTSDFTDDCRREEKSTSI